MVNHHCLVITLVSQFHLLHKTLFLVNRVVQLRVSISQLFTVHHQLKAFCKTSLRTVHLGQRRHLHRIVGDESGLDERTFAEFAKEFVNQLTLTHRLVHFHALLQAESTNLLLRLAFAVEAGLFLDGIQDRQTTIRSLEAHHIVTNLHVCRAVHSHTNLLQQLLRERHHPVIVLISHIQFHAGELRVVASVHSFIAEVTANLIHTLETAHDKTLQVELRSNTQIQIHVQRIMVCDERTSRCTTCYLLKNRSLHFRETSLIKHLTHGAQDGGTLQERVLHPVVHNQVHITLAVAQFWVFKRIEHLTILLLHNGQWLQALRQNRQGLGMHTNLTRLCAKHKALHANKVAQIQQLLEHHVIQVLVLLRTDVITCHIHLNPAL